MTDASGRRLRGQHLLAEQTPTFLWATPTEVVVINTKVLGWKDLAIAIHYYVSSSGPFRNASIP